MPMSNREALEVVARERRDLIVISTMASVTGWPELSNSPLDFAYMPSAMGEAPALGLGMALAKPSHGVIVLNGDGSMLMNLGSLVTIGSQSAPLYLIIMDNGLYEITGGQLTAGAGHTDFAGLARAAGITRVYEFEEAAAWRAKAAEALSGKGPVVVWLKVEGRLGQKTPVPPKPMADQLTQIRKALAS